MGDYCPTCAFGMGHVNITTTTITKPASNEENEAPAGSPAFHALLDELRDLHERKNAGYAGHSTDPFVNFRQCEAFGIKATNGVITRLSDKWSRLQALWADAGNEQVGESIRDTLLDMSAYALILICLLEETDN